MMNPRKKKITLIIILSILILCFIFISYLVLTNKINILADILRFTSSSKEQKGTYPANIIQKNNLRVSAIKLDTADMDLIFPDNILINKINQLLSGGKTIDLIVTPEFSLYYKIMNNYIQKKRYPIKISFNRTNNIYTVSSTNSTYSRRAVVIIKEVQKIAKNNQVNIVLGSVPEIKYFSDDPNLGSNAIFETTLIIDRDGNIIDIRRKSIGSYWVIGTSNLNKSYAYKLTTDTISKINLKDKEGENFNLLTVYSEELGNDDLLNKANNYNADLMVMPQRGMGDDCEALMQNIQDKKILDTNNYCYVLFDRTLITKYTQEKNIIKKGGYFIIAEGHRGKGGIINLSSSPSPLASLSITTNYVFGKIILPYPNNSPRVGTNTPSSGSSYSEIETTFTSTYLDPNGWRDITDGRIIINTYLGGTRCFYGRYDQNSHRLYLSKNTDNNEKTRWIDSCVPGSDKVLANSYTKLNCAKTTVKGLGNTLTIKWNITFKSMFAGTQVKNIYLFVRDDSFAHNGWAQKGTWLIKP